jgi:flagellar biosynthesis protein FlhG
VLSAASPALEIGVVVNNVRDGEAASLAFRQLDIVASRFLSRQLKYYGFISEDPAVRDALVTQRAIVEYMPQAPASRCFRILAARIASLDPAQGRGLRLVTDTERTIPVTEVPQCA